MTRRALVVDDEVNMRWVLKEALIDFGYAVETAGGGQEALAAMGREPADLVILDLKMKGMDGLGTLARLRERWPEAVVLILTAHGTVATAVEAMQLGAADYLRKPFDVEEIGFKIQRALERKTLQAEVRRLRRALDRQPAAQLAGAHPAWRRCLDQALAAAPQRYPLLVIGEPGAGKTALARLIHHEAAAGPLAAVDLRMFPAPAQAGIIFDGGAWEQAGAGTLLLQHAEALAPGLWPRLLEAGRRPPAGPRLLVTGDAALPAPWPGGQIALPALRERPGDIPLLAAAFAPGAEWTAAARQALERYAWPGNVAELRSVVERAVALAAGQPVAPAHLPEALGAADPQAPILLPAEGLSLEAVEVALIRQALERANGNKTRAAELLGVTRHTLLYRLEKHGLDGRDGVGAPAGEPIAPA